MPAIRFSDQDIKAGFLVKNPGRYNYMLADYKTKAAKTDGSTNYILRFVGLNGEMKDVPVFVIISSKAQWLWTPIFTAANGGKELVPDQDYDIDTLKDIRLSAVTNRGTRDGIQFNQLQDWKPFDETLKG